MRVSIRAALFASGTRTTTRSSENMLDTRYNYRRVTIDRVAATVDIVLVLTLPLSLTASLSVPAKTHERHRNDLTKRLFVMAVCGWLGKATTWNADIYFACFTETVCRCRHRSATCSRTPATHSSLLAATLPRRRASCDTVALRPLPDIADELSRELCDGAWL